MTTSPNAPDKSPPPPPPPLLPVLSTHRISNPARFSALCGSRDLLAVVHASWDVSIYRIISGQVAFVIKRKEECEVQCLAWKANGGVLAVAWSDGAYGLHEGERGGLISTGRVEVGGTVLADDWRLDLRPDFGPDEDEDGPGVMVCRFGWAEHLTQGLRKTGAEKFSHDDDDNDCFDDINDENTNETVLPLTGLPAAITLLDVTTVLPRLSAIPTHGMSIAKAGPAGNKFSTLMATDGVFESKKDVSSGLVQDLLVCQGEGTVQVLLDETVRIGSCNVGARPIMQASHTMSPYHAVLTEDEDAQLHLNFIHLPLPALGGPLLHVIATNTKRIQNLLDYVLHTVRCIEHDFTTGLQFPQRILNSLDGMLQDHNEGDVPSNLYHLAMTGEFNASTLEWLTDIVKDPNHKRWDSAVGTMYSILQNHLFTNLFPALDRLCIAASALRGQAAFHEGSSKFDCPPELFANILSTIDCLRLVGEKALLVVTAESREFRAFSRWLKMQIDVAHAEPLSKNALEVEEREVPSIEYTLVLRYIKETMMRSRLAVHVITRSELQQGLDQKDFFAHDIVRNMTFENTNLALKRGEKSISPNGTADETDMALLNLPAISAVLQGRVRVALQQITAWQSRMLSAPVRVPVDINEPVKVFDMMLCPSAAKKKPLGADPGDTATRTNIIARQASSNDVVLITAYLSSAPSTKLRSSESTPTSSFSTRHRKSLSATSPAFSRTTSTLLAAPEGSHLLDAKFLSPTPASQTQSNRFHADREQRRTSFLALFRHEESEYVSRSTDLALYSMASPSSSSPSFSDSSNTLPDDNEADVEIQTLHSFSAEEGFVPQNISIGGREDKMVCVVWGSKGREWMVLDLAGVLRRLRATSHGADGDSG